MAESTPFTLFYINGKTVMGKQIPSDDSTVRTDFASLGTSEDLEKYIFIENPATVEFSIQQTAATSAATMAWKVMPFIPKYIKATKGDKFLFAFAKELVALCNKGLASSIISDLQNAYNEIK